MRFIKRLGWTVLGLVGLVILLYLITLAVNWRDRPPSASYVQLEQVITSRPAVADADNAIVYLLGFSAPADQDPRSAGQRRFDWLKTFNDQTKPDSDPLPHPLDLKSNGSPQMDQLGKACGDQDRKGCADGFAAAAAGWSPTATEALALQRFRTLLGFHAWREVLPSHLSAPLPAYGGIMHAHRLYLLSLMQLAGQGKVAEVRAGLSADCAYWRGAQQNAETLLAKMIAIAGLRNHFFYSNLILRSLPAEQVLETMPADWQRAFTDEERSMRLVMGGEMLYAKSILDYTVRSSDLVDSMTGTYERTTLGRWLDRLAVPMFQAQDTANHYADNHLRFLEQFAVPMNQYPAAKTAVEAYASTHVHSYSIYNPMGDAILRWDDGTNFLSYAFRSANPEGMRRAALLVTQLRAREVTPEAAPGVVANAGLRDPYDEAPFAWDAQRASVIFTAREDSVWSRHEYFY